MAWHSEAFARSPVPSVLFGPDGRALEVNPAYRQRFGLQPGEGPGSELWEGLHPDDLPSVQQVREGLEGDEPPTAPIEVRVRAADGSWRWTILTVTGLPGHEECVLSLIDVTGHREAEARRAREARYLQTLLERSADIITVLGADGEWRYSSPQGTSVLGYPRGHDPSGGIWALVHPEDRDLAATALAEVIAGDRSPSEAVELRIVTARGDIRRFEVVGVNLLDDPVVAGVVATARDVTDRHEAHEALAASEARFGDLVAHMQEGLWAIDAAADTTFVNPRMAEMLGASPEEMIGSNLFDWIPPEDVASIAAHFETRRAGVSEVHELRLRRTDGSVLTTLASASPRMVGGAMVEAIAVITDISQLMETQAELDAALRRAQDADRAKSVFLSHVSHELRTPLNAVLGYATLLTQVTSDPAVVEFAGEVEFAGRHLLRLIEDLLHVTRLETGPIPLHLEAVPLAEVVAEAAALAGIPTDRMRVMVGGLGVAADRTRLRQVLVNVLANADTHGPADGVVGVVAARAGDRVRTTVWDEGPGVADADAERIFEPFVQIGDGSGPHTGTGLGLPISRRLTEAMGGRLRHDPGPPNGFVIDLPGTEPAVRPATAHEPMQRCAVLVVEDDPGSRRLLEAVVAAIAECDVRAAATLEEARRSMSGAPTDVVLLDVNLPDGNGLEFLRELRSDGSTADLPVVVLTADTDPVVRDRAFDAGATAFGTKPYDIPTLTATLRAIGSTGLAAS